MKQEYIVRSKCGDDFVMDHIGSVVKLKLFKKKADAFKCARAFRKAEVYQIQKVKEFGKD